MRSTIEQLQKDNAAEWNEFITIHRYSESDFKGKQVLDIGANIGYVSRLALAWGARRVIAVEMDQTNVIELQKNCSDCPEIMILPVAAHGFARHVSITMSPGDQRTNCKALPATSGIPALPLADLVNLLDPGDDDMTLKVDVEGAEYDLLLCAPITALRRFSTIMLETHKIPHLKAHPARKADYLMTYMKYLGYEIMNEEPLCWYGADGQVSKQEDMSAYRMRRVEMP